MNEDRPKTSKNVIWETIRLIRVGWCKQAFMLNHKNKEIDFPESGPVKYGLYGALCVAGGYNYANRLTWYVHDGGTKLAYQAIKIAIKKYCGEGKPIICFNNDENRTVEDVLNVLFLALNILDEEKSKNE